MKHMANDGTIFDKLEDCLRYEGACEERNRSSKGGCGLVCLGILVFIFMLLVKMAEMA